MKRLLIVVLGLAVLASAVPAHAQSGAVRRKPEPKNDNSAPPPEGSQPDADKPLSPKGVTKRAVITAKPEPVYPRSARRNGVEGTVVLRIILAASGEVDERMTVIQGLPAGLTEAAMKAARAIQFIPAEKDGRRVSQYVTVAYNFNLH